MSVHSPPEGYVGAEGGLTSLEPVCGDLAVGVGWLHVLAHLRYHSQQLVIVGLQAVQDGRRRNHDPCGWMTSQSVTTQTLQQNIHIFHCCPPVGFALFSPATTEICAAAGAAPDNPGTLWAP